MHITLSIHVDKTEAELAQQTETAGIRLYSLNTYRLNKNGGIPSFLLGFGRLSEDEISTGIHQLMDTWSIQKKKLKNTRYSIFKLFFIFSSTLVFRNL